MGKKKTEPELISYNTDYSVVRANHEYVCDIFYDLHDDCSNWSKREYDTERVSYKLKEYYESILSDTRWQINNSLWPWYFLRYYDKAVYYLKFGSMKKELMGDSFIVYQHRMSIRKRSKMKTFGRDAWNILVGSIRDSIKIHYKELGEDTRLNHVVTEIELYKPKCERDRIKRLMKKIAKR